VAATRSAVTSADDPILELTEKLEPVHRAVLRSSLPGHGWGDARRGLAKGYENIGQPAHGANTSRVDRLPSNSASSNSRPLKTDSPYWTSTVSPTLRSRWNPSLRGGAKIEETYLVSNDGFELLTSSGAWATTANDGGMQHSQVKVVQ